MEWLYSLFTAPGVAQTVVIYGIVIAIGIWLGRLKIGGISLGVTWVLFMGILVSYAGISVNNETGHFLKEFGLILFVYSIGLQVGPGFFASLKKNALANNLLAALVVFLGVLITIVFFYSSGSPITTLTGVMSGAVTNTPGLGAAQQAVKDLHPDGNAASLMTLAYAVAYPFGVFGIILAMLLLKKLFRVELETERELHRKLDIVRSNKPVSCHLNLDNPQLTGQPLRRLFELVKEPIVISRMLHQGTVITPTPDTVLASGDVLLVVASRKEMEQLKLLIGSPSNLNLKAESSSNLI